MPSNNFNGEFVDIKLTCNLVPVVQVLAFDGGETETVNIGMRRIAQKTQNSQNTTEIELLKCGNRWRRVISMYTYR